MAETRDADAEEAVYTPSTQQLDLERRLREEKGEVDPDFVPRDFTGGRPPEELDAFVGVSAEYRNYADDTGRPYFAEDGSAEAEFEIRHVDNSDRIVVGFSQEELDRRAENEKAVQDQQARDAGVEVPEETQEDAERADRMHGGAAPSATAQPVKPVKASAKAPDKPKD